MSVPVTLTIKEESSYNSIPTEDLCENRSDSTAEAQICRTCTHVNRRDWLYGPNARLAALERGASPEDFTCASDKVSVTLKVQESTDWRDQVIPLEMPSTKRIVSFVDSCGQSIQQKCKNCSRFVPTQIRIPYDPSGGKIVHKKIETNSGTQIVPIKEDGTNPHWWKVTVGGHCSIPAEGIVVDNEITYCDPQPRKYNVENPSCNNCAYLWRPSDNWMFDHLQINEAAALNPWEREEAQKRFAHMDSPAASYGIALFEKQNEPYGRMPTYAASLIDMFYDSNKQLCVTVKFVDSRMKAKLPVEHSHWHFSGLPRYEDFVANPNEYRGSTIACDILWPMMEKFGLGLPTHYAPRIWPKLPEQKVIRSILSSVLVNDDCPRCRTKPRPKPCYYHSKDPHYKFTTGEIEFRNPNGLRDYVFYNPLRELSVVLQGDNWVVVDGNGNLPTAYGDEVANASVFRMLLKTLLGEAHKLGGEKAVKAVKEQYREVTSGLRRTKPRRVRGAWLRNIAIDPSRPVCTHPKGLNLRQQFQDEFGSERTDWNFDTGLMTKMEVSEELRVGKRQHSQTPQRLQEEIMSNIYSHPRYNPASDEIPEIPVNIRISTSTHIEAVGDMTDTFGNPVTSTSEFYDNLDTDVIVGWTPDGMPRKISKRRQLYGYDLSRGFYGKRKGFEKVANISLDTDTAIFESSFTDIEQIDIEDVWECPNCATQYGIDEVDPYWLVCECGSDLYRHHNRQTPHNPRKAGGVGAAIVADSPRTQERRRLESFVCPNWKLRANKTITLDDVSLPGQKDASSTKEETHSTKVERFEVGRDLSPEQEKANAEYQARAAEVIKKRAEHLAQNPDTSTSELHRLYPTPGGVIYVRKAIGSAAKMG